jgi:ABC-type lipoprotein release transport system permease subunit
MRENLILAWRNVWRNRRRSLITIAAVVFSVLIITLTRSLQYGSYDAMEASAVQMYTGEIQIQRPGYREEQTLEYALDGDEEAWRAALEGAPWLEATTRRLTGFGLVSSDEFSAGAMIVGVEPEAERQVSRFSDRVTLGLPLRDDSDHEVLLGQILARNLRVEVGDTVVVLTQGWRNQMGADLYRVRGLLRTGSVEMDRGIMILPLPDAQFLFSMGDRVTEVVLRTDDFREARSYAESIRQQLPDDRFSVYDWDALMPELRQMIVLDNVSGAIYLLFLLVLVGFEIFNTTTMSVMERVREFGLLQALGMRPQRIARLVLAELAVKVAVALAVSIGASGLLLWYLEGNPIPMPAEFVEMYEEFGFSVDALVFSTRPAVFLEPLLAVAVIALLATIYPVLRVLNLTTIYALRRGT